jgi:hypothetical protein
MKGCVAYFFIFANFIFISNMFNLVNSNFLKYTSNDMGAPNSNSYSNELVPGLNDVNRLKKIIEDLVIYINLIYSNFLNNLNRQLN